VTPHQPPKPKAGPKPILPPKPKAGFTEADIKVKAVLRSGQIKFEANGRTFTHDEGRRVIEEVVDGK